MEPFEKKINEYTQVRAIPAVLVKLLTALDNEESPTSAIAEIVNQDISLTARLLRAANSAFYGRQFEINTVNRALSVLGMKAVRALALSVSIYDITNGLSPIDGFDIKEFWRHNLETAIIAQKLAGANRCCQPEEAFACGLMHDLGVLFFIEEYPLEYAGIIKSQGKSKQLEQAEREVFKTTHAEVGSAIASIWRLPDDICKSIANHHKEEFPKFSHTDPQAWHIVNLAHRFCRNGHDINSQQHLILFGSIYP